MSGVDLMSLSSPDLLDVIHYMFEDDLGASTEEEVDAKDKYRIRIYEDLYERPYNYASPKNSGANRAFDPNLPPFDDPVNEGDFEPEGIQKATKAYTPPTAFNEGAANPYHGVLDAPLG